VAENLLFKILIHLFIVLCIPNQTLYFVIFLYQLRLISLTDFMKSIWGLLHLHAQILVFFFEYSVLLSSNYHFSYFPLNGFIIFLPAVELIALLLMFSNSKNIVFYYNNSLVQLLHLIHHSLGLNFAEIHPNLTKICIMILDLVSLGWIEVVTLHAS
jgi:hypothetical protein